MEPVKMDEKRLQKITDAALDVAQNGSKDSPSRPQEITFNFVTGEQWRRIKPQPSPPLTTPISYVVLSYTMRDPCFSVNECAKELMWMQKCQMYKVKLADIRYNFIIGGNGSVFEIRGWNKRPALMSRMTKFNSKCLYIGLMGTFKAAPPEPTMIEAQRELLKYGVRNNYITPRFNVYALRGGDGRSQHSFIQMESL